MTAPVEVLREAAKVLRQRAERAVAGPWRYNSDKMWNLPGLHYGVEFIGAGPLGETVCVAATGEADDPQSMVDARYIATMDPIVGLALADALDSEAEMCEVFGLSSGEEPMVKVAHAVLGGEPT